MLVINPSDTLNVKTVEKLLKLDAAASCIAPSPTKSRIVRQVIVVST